MEHLNEFRIEQCFSSDAGPVWICRQIYDRHEDNEQVDENPPIAFWRNDRTLKNPKREPGYYCCWKGAASRTSGIYLMVFATAHLPWIGSYGIRKHMDPIELKPDPRIQEEFDPGRARQGQAFAGREVITVKDFLDMYPLVRFQLRKTNGA